MSTMEIQSLNSEISNERISMPYPHINLLEPSDAIALMVPSLPVGNLPIICEYNNSVRQIGSVRNSALVLNNLRKISKIEYVFDKHTKREIKTPKDAVEVFT